MRSMAMSATQGAMSVCVRQRREFKIIWPQPLQHLILQSMPGMKIDRLHNTSDIE